MGGPGRRWVSGGGSAGPRALAAASARVAALPSRLNVFPSRSPRTAIFYARSDFRARVPDGPAARRALSGPDRVAGAVVGAGAHGVASDRRVAAGRAPVRNRPPPPAPLPNLHLCAADAALVLR